MQVRITATNGELNEELRSLTERRIRFAVTRFASRMMDVLTELSDESGPHDATAIKCRIAVRLRPNGRVSLEAVDQTFEVAVRIAVDRASRSVARHLEHLRLGRKREDHGVKSRLDVEP